MREFLVKLILLCIKYLLHLSWKNNGIVENYVHRQKFIVFRIHCVFKLTIMFYNWMKNLCNLKRNAEVCHLFVLNVLNGKAKEEFCIGCNHCYEQMFSYKVQLNTLLNYRWHMVLTRCEKFVSVVSSLDAKSLFQWCHLCDCQNGMS